jgi:hypothetical protein
MSPDGVSQNADADLDRVPSFQLANLYHKLT